MAGEVAARLAAKPDLRLCLPTGGTPVPVYDELAARTAPSWQHAHVFVLDEFGGLARDDPARCAATLRRQLVDRIDLPARGFHALDIDLPDLDLAARAYDELIGDGFDLVLLGIGSNGHVGLNEPGSDPDSPTRVVQLAPESRASAARYVDHDRPPTWGMTVGLRAILASREVWLLATGAAKASVVAQALDGPETVDLPASLLRRHPRCTWWLDEAAAGR